MYIKTLKCINMKKEKNIIIRVPENTLKEYKELCEKNGYSMSKRLRNYIMSEIKTMNKDG